MPIVELRKMGWKQLAIDQSGKTSPIGEKLAAIKGSSLRVSVYRCSMCNGTGKARSGTNCQSCKGEKVHEIEGPVVKCAFCRGRGRQPGSAETSCQVCVGSGWVRIEQPIETCPECKGQGRRTSSRLPCLSCRGNGCVTVKAHCAKQIDSGFQEK